MTELLNKESCMASRGVKHPRSITVTRYHILFSAHAERELVIKPGDKISFRITDGDLYMFFDPKSGFDVLEKKAGSGYTACFISNAKLCFNILRFGKKLHIGEFNSGAYRLMPIKT